MYHASASERHGGGGLIIHPRQEGGRSGASNGVGHLTGYSARISATYSCENLFRTYGGVVSLSEEEARLATYA